MTKFIIVDRLPNEAQKLYRIIEGSINHGDYDVTPKLLEKAVKKFKGESMEKFINTVNDDRYSFLEMLLKSVADNNVSSNEQLLIALIEELLQLGARKEGKHYKGLIENIESKSFPYSERIIKVLNHRSHDPNMEFRKLDKEFEIKEYNEIETTENTPLIIRDEDNTEPTGCCSCLACCIIL